VPIRLAAVNRAAPSRAPGRATMAVLPAGLENGAGMATRPTHVAHDEIENILGQNGAEPVG